MMKNINLIKKMIREAVLREQEGQLFDSETAQDVANQIKLGLSAPYVQPIVSTLGGKENVTIILKISLDPKEDWINQIYQNSRYSQFSITKDGIVEQPYRNYKLQNFRKTKVKTVKDLILKLNQYFDKLNKD